jgi:uncharacterized membrane protein YhhN
VWISLLVLAPLIAALELRAEHRELRRQVYLFKPLATLCLTGIAATTPVPVSETYRAFVVLGLLCSLAGDVALMLPRDRFVPGLLSFLLAHICYIAGFVSLGGWPPSPAVALLLVAYGLYLLRRLWPAWGDTACRSRPTRPRCSSWLPPRTRSCAKRGSCDRCSP